MKYLVVAISTAARGDIEDSPYLSLASMKGVETPEEVYAKAAMQPEYGMVCCLSAYMVKFGKDNLYSIENVLSLTSGDMEGEEALLLSFESALQRFGTDTVLVGYDIKGFTVPFLAKRYLGHGLCIPVEIRNAIKGNVIDIMEELSCGGNSTTSLRSSAWLLGIQDELQLHEAPKSMLEHVLRHTDLDASTAANVFSRCVSGELIKVEEHK